MQILLVGALAMLALTSGGKAQASEARFALEISTPKLLLNLPSGSAVTAQGGRFWVFGDDSPWAYELDNSLSIKDKHQLGIFSLDPAGRIAKQFKPDLESSAAIRLNGFDHQVVLGSGSEAGLRERGYLIRENRDGAGGGIGLEVKEFQLAPLYAQLKRVGGLDRLNIEGLIVAGPQVLLLNRVNAGGNMIFAIPKEEFIDYVQGRRSSVSRPEAIPVRLPAVDGFEAGLSGGEYWPERDSLVYTASVEATGNAYADGAVLGSFVGVISRRNLRSNVLLDLVDTAIPLSRDGRIVLTKAESIAVESGSLRKIKGVIVSDNDDGTSEFFWYQLVAY